MNFFDSALGMMVMDSDYLADKIITMLKAGIDKGYDPNEYQWSVYEYLRITPDDIMKSDRERIDFEVSKYYLNYKM